MRGFKFELNEVKTDLMLYNDRNQRSVQVAKNMMALCEKVFFALKLRSDDSSVLVSIAASGRSSKCRLDGFGSFSIEQ